METIFKGTYSEAAIVKSMLENSNIPAYSSNENMALALSVDGFQAVLLRVHPQDAAKAAALVQDFREGKLPQKDV